jgi:hypothetical protein
MTEEGYYDWDPSDDQRSRRQAARQRVSGAKARRPSDETIRCGKLTADCRKLAFIHYLSVLCHEHSFSCQ